MHELSLLNDIFGKINRVARENDADRVLGVKIRLGALSHISAGHFREHFADAAKGTIVENAKLEVVEDDDPEAPDAQEMILESIELPE